MKINLTRSATLWALIALSATVTVAGCSSKDAVDTPAEKTAFGGNPNDPAAIAAAQKAIAEDAARRATQKIPTGPPPAGAPAPSPAPATQ